MGISDVGFAARAILLGRADLARPALEAARRRTDGQEACALAALLELPACAGPPASARDARDDALVRLVLVDRLHAAGDDLGESRAASRARSPGDDLVEEALARLVGDGALAEGVTPSVNVRAWRARTARRRHAAGARPRLALASRVLDAPGPTRRGPRGPPRARRGLGSVVAAWSRLGGPSRRAPAGRGARRTHAPRLVAGSPARRGRRAALGSPPSPRASRR